MAGAVMCGAVAIVTAADASSMVFAEPRVSVAAPATAWSTDTTTVVPSAALVTL